MAADATAIGTLIIALTGLVAAIASLLAIVLTHQKVSKINGGIAEINTTVNAVHDDTQSIVNGGATHDPGNV